MKETLAEERRACQVTAITDQLIFFPEPEKYIFVSRGILGILWVFSMCLGVKFWIKEFFQCKKMTNVRCGNRFKGYFGHFVGVFNVFGCNILD